MMRGPRQASSETRPEHENDASFALKALERNLARDLSHLGEVADVGDVGLHVPGHATPTTSSAHVVLIARGPIQCLVAQYFLER